MRLVQNIFLPYAAMIAAEAVGAFGANGVEVDTRFTRSSLDQRASLLTGDADVAVTALDNLFAWNQPDDADFRAVAQIEQRRGEHGSCASCDDRSRKRQRERHGPGPGQHQREWYGQCQRRGREYRRK